MRRIVQPLKQLSGVEAPSFNGQSLVSLRVCLIIEKLKKRNTAKRRGRDLLKTLQFLNSPLFPSSDNVLTIERQNSMVLILRILKPKPHGGVM